jgi:hypothetical protein
VPCTRKPLTAKLLAFTSEGDTSLPLVREPTDKKSVAVMSYFRVFGVFRGSCSLHEAYIGNVIAVAGRPRSQRRLHGFGQDHHTYECIHALVGLLFPWSRPNSEYIHCPRLVLLVRSLLPFPTSRFPGIQLRQSFVR